MPTKIGERMPIIHRENLGLPGKFTPPENQIQCKICICFATALEMDHVGADDDFFDLGGESLTVQRLVLLFAEHEILQIPAVKLMTLGTPRKLGIWIETQSQG
jgi:hypothetical protein